MELLDYLKKFNVSAKKFARISGLSYDMILILTKKKAKDIRLVTAIKINLASYGHITATDLLKNGITEKILDGINENIDKENYKNAVTLLKEDKKRGK